MYGYKCSKSTATYTMLLILLSKIATSNHMTEIKVTMPGNAVSDRLSTVSLHPGEVTALAPLRLNA